jgi:hypothetical protein
MTPWTASWIGGLSLIALTIAMHAVGLVFLARLLQQVRGTVGPYHLRRQANVWVAIAIVGMAGAALAALHAVEAAVWAIAYLHIGAIDTPSDAILYSIDSMTTRGASGLVLEREWRLMGALESADGMLLFGISTAFLFAVIQHIWPMALGPRRQPPSSGRP